MEHFVPLPENGDIPRSDGRHAATVGGGRGREEQVAAGR